MGNKPEHRIDRIVSDLLRGRRLKLRGSDSEEKEAITAAARLAGTRQGPQRMHPAFRRKLARALEQPPAETWVTRRTALVAGLGLAAGAAAGGLIGRSVEASPATPGGGAIDPVHGKWVDVAAFSDLVEGKPIQVKAGSVGAFVFRKGDSVSGVSSICSHLPCELWWDHGSSLLACPCHPATFASDGSSNSRPYPLPTLNTVHVRVTDAGRVEVLGTD